MTPYRKKLIEVALPLEDINRESAREKSIRHGHPSTLHLWWARRPLAACRAVLFSSLVDDPDSDPQFKKSDGSVDVGRAGLRRAELFNLIKELVKWENSNDPKILNAARAEIAASIASRKIADTREWLKDQVICREKAWNFVCRLAKPENVSQFLLEYAPPVLDPFCGGGSIPLEAQRLGLRAFGSDLNPVPVLITKALIEIPPKFAHMPPVNPGSDKRLKDGWKGAQGLAEDVRYYGQWMRDEAEKRIGNLYPKIKITEEMAADRPDLRPYLGEELTAIAWIWARTVASPNPAVGGAYVPLVRSFWLSTKKGKEAWVEPVIDRENNSYRFEVRVGKPTAEFDPGIGTVGRKGGRCVLSAGSNSLMPLTHIRAEGKAGRMSVKLMAMVAEGTRGRVYLSPLEPHEGAAASARPSWKPDCQLPVRHRNFQTPAYGMPNLADLFTARQLKALTTFSDLVKNAREKVLADARQSGLFSANNTCSVGLQTCTNTTSDACPQARTNIKTNQTTDDPAAATLRTGTAKHGAGQGVLAANDDGLDGCGTKLRAGLETYTTNSPESYADAVATYLAFAVDKSANYWSSLCGWNTGFNKLISTFGRQALPMVWDYAEANPFSESSGNFLGGIDQAGRSLSLAPAGAPGSVSQLGATADRGAGAATIISTDPPYYDNIGYADLSDFFYVWLRRSLGDIYPELFKTLLTPKAEELIATPYRHGGSKHEAQKFFETGLGETFHRMREMQPPEYPMTVFYAFKQSEEVVEEEVGGGHPGRRREPEAGETPAPQTLPRAVPQSASATASTGWETMLAGLRDAGFSITGTWPMRTELVGNLKKNMSALASSIVLSCRPRPADAPLATRREFLAALKRELPDALRHLQEGNIAPVDLAQASIGPGMAIYTRYAKIMDADGTPMGVRAALAAINQMLDEVLAEQEGEFDPDTRWAVAWFGQFGMEDGPFGEAETLSRAKNTAVNGLVEAGIIAARGGKVRLLKRGELEADWDPAADKRLVHWEIVQYLIRALDAGGEAAAGDLLRVLGSVGEMARDLAYRLYNICERKKWAEEALAYNSLVIAWPEIAQLARREKVVKENKTGLF